LGFDLHVLFFTLSMALLTLCSSGRSGDQGSETKLIEVLKVGGRGAPWLDEKPVPQPSGRNRDCAGSGRVVGSGFIYRSMQKRAAHRSRFEFEKSLRIRFRSGALHYEEGRASSIFAPLIDRAKTSPGSNRQPSRPISAWRWTCPQPCSPKVKMKLPAIVDLDPLDDIAPNFSGNAGHSMLLAANHRLRLKDTKQGRHC